MSEYEQSKWPDIQGFADRLDLDSSTQSGRRQQSLDKTQGITSQKNNGYINNMFMNTPCKS